MGIFLNILVILFAVITFLVLYYITSRDRERQNNHLPLNNNIDFEVGEEIGVDKKDMKEGNNENASSYNESLFSNNETTVEHHQQEIWLKEKYGQEYIRLFSRDPNFLFAYWELNNEEYYNHEPCLRLYNESEDVNYDINIDHDSQSWYLHAKANNKYRVMIGYKKDGIFYPIAISNSVQTPLDRPSDIIDEHWMTIEGLSQYSYRIEMDTLAMMKNIEARKLLQDLKADSYSISRERS